MEFTARNMWWFVFLACALGCNRGARTALDAGTEKTPVMVADSGKPASAGAVPESGAGGAVSAGTGASDAQGGVGGSIDQPVMDAGTPRRSVAVDAAITSASADAGGGDAGAAPALDSEIASAVSAVDAMRIASSVAKLAAFTTRNTCSNNTSSGNAIGAARDWIQAQLQAAPSFTVSLEDFAASGCGRGTGAVQNVLAVKLGARPERVFVIGGHYDSRSINGNDPTSVAPGANDSGSQTAALIEVAHVLARIELDATVLIAAFAGEEQGLLGSAQLAKEVAKFVVPDAAVEAMFNLDIVGGDNTVNNEATLQQFRLFSPGTPRERNTRTGATDDTSPARGVMRYIGHWGRVFVPSMTMVPVLREDRPSRGGDHESFNDVGIPAVRFIETMESPNSGTNESHQHSPNDLPMYVTPSYTARIAQIVASVAASLARAPMAPKIEGATVGAAGAVTVRWSAPAAGPAVDHYVIAARPTSENFYHARVVAPAAATSREVTALELGLAPGSAFFLSVASVDRAGHESLFAYPEHRCDASGCVVQPGSLDVTTRN